MQILSAGGGASNTPAVTKQCKKITLATSCSNTNQVTKAPLAVGDLCELKYLKVTGGTYSSGDLHLEDAEGNVITSTMPSLGNLYRGVFGISAKDGDNPHQDHCTGNSIVAKGGIYLVTTYKGGNTNTATVNADVVVY